MHSLHVLEIEVPQGMNGEHAGLTPLLATESVFTLITASTTPIPTDTSYASEGPRRSHSSSGDGKASTTSSPNAKQGSQASTNGSGSGPDAILVTPAASVVHSGHTLSSPVAPHLLLEDVDPKDIIGNALRIKISGSLDPSSGLFDEYAAQAFFPNSGHPVDVILKASDPNTFSDPASAAGAVRHEAEVYSKMAALQRKTVPHFYGLWYGVYSSPWSTAKYEMYIMMLEDTGRTLLNAPGLSVASWSAAEAFHSRIRTVYQQLHAGGVVHCVRDLAFLGTRNPRTDDDDVPFEQDPEQLAILEFGQAVCRGDPLFEAMLSEEERWLAEVITSP